MNDFYKQVLSNVEKNSTTLSPATYSTYLSHISKLRQYAPNAKFSEINEKFVMGYIAFMRLRGNCDATIYRSLSILRMHVNALVRQGLVRVNPFGNIPLRRSRSRREFLELDEFSRLYHRFIEGEHDVTDSEREALRAFLFSCFTGLRYSDLKGLSPHDIRNGKIRLFTHKTGTMVYIPVPQQALALLPGEGKSAHQANASANSVLHVIDNSTFNKRLRSGAKKLGCFRHLHAHLVRHTFATSCISFGVPIEVVSKLLGHTNLQTTLVYANYSSSVIDREMQKFVL
ncbi:tyrosine-type recombinase/integrase [Fibrobacter sp.]